ncbi:MAG TPA: hypothetical protein VHZ28_04495 [Terracidiphilus sp.]|jgi:hypothetical protein|nr:hypothetical protein [Terracidiphilus sp.]
MMVMMMVMPVRSERGTGNYSEEQGDKDPLLHGIESSTHKDL